MREETAKGIEGSDKQSLIRSIEEKVEFFDQSGLFSDQTILPLYRELLQKDVKFRKKITEIKYGLASYHLKKAEADMRYYCAMDDAIRRIRTSRSTINQKAA